MSKTLETAKTGHDFVEVGRKSKNLKSERHPGSHWQATTDLGRLTVADHNKELAPWLRIKIRKEFIAIGLTLALLVFGYFQLVV